MEDLLELRKKLISNQKEAEGILPEKLDKKIQVENLLLEQVDR